MKKLFLSILFFWMFFLGISQNSLKVKLLEVYSSEITEGILSDCQKKSYYSNLLFHSYKVTKFEKVKKDSKIPVISKIKYKNSDGTSVLLTPQKVVEMIDKGDFNIMRAGFSRNLKTSNSFVLGKTNKIIILFSQEQINNQAKKQKC